MAKVTILDNKYTKVPAGWTSLERVEVGTVRMIDGGLHYAYSVDEEIIFLCPPFWPKTWRALWVPVVRERHVMEQDI